MKFTLLKRESVEETMTSKERYLAALEGDPVDRPPVGSPTSVATVEQMELTDSFFPEAHYDRDSMFDLAVGAFDILGYDAVMPHFSVWIGGATIGIPVDWGDKKSKMPDGKKAIWEKPADISIPSRIGTIEPAKSLLWVISKIAREYPDVCVIGKVMGPWTLAYHGYRTDNFLKKTLTDPKGVKETLDTLAEFTLEFGKLQIEAGADALCIPEHITGDLVGPETYREFLMPLHQRLLPQFDDYEAPLILHCCGDTLDRIKYFERAGWDAYHIESKVDAFEAKREVKEMKLIGNVNNPDTLWQSTSAHVQLEALYAARACFDVLSPECAIPTTTSDKNLKAISKTAKKLSPVN